MYIYCAQKVDVHSFGLINLIAKEVFGMKIFTEDIHNLVTSVQNYAQLLCAINIQLLDGWNSTVTVHQPEFLMELQSALNKSSCLQHQPLLNLFVSSICTAVGVGNSPQGSLCADNVPAVYNALLRAMTDYTLDSRGDVGAW